MALRLLTACGLLALSLTGCGGGGASGGADRLPTHKVTGTVKLAGGPVAEASVTFSPLEGQPVAFGRTDSAGQYTLTTYEAGDGAVAGTYKVLVSKSSAAKSDAGGGSHDAYISGSFNPGASHSGKGAGKSAGALPDKYARADSTDLVGKVEAGKENVIDLELNP
ncbi:MAG: carboxypeptidase regulatory-like domain-containing protein [Planctomycetaceae bacterium]|nr:carboxypeptidase regulatory-like domain-containing protein [Planctomycetaceae bacterium]